MPEFEPVDAPPRALREAHLDGLAQHQEYFLEELVGTGQAWRLDDSAYVVVNGPNIVEFHVDASLHDRTQAVFDQAVAKTGAGFVLCASYDTPLVFAALARTARATASGILFRSLSGRPKSHHPETAFRRARDTDMAAIMAINDDFFPGPEEVERLLTGGALFVLERDGAIIGCGTRVRVNPGRPAVDLGMLVAADERGRGYGTHIIARMRDDALDEGLAPVCGCAARNAASRRALLKAGFVDGHRLLRIELPAG